MNDDMMNLEQLAKYLERDMREIRKLLSRGRVPGHKVGGEWRFARAEINHWIETHLHSYTEKQLSAVEELGGHTADGALLIANLLSEASVAVPLPAATKASVLRELVSLAEQSW